MLARSRAGGAKRNAALTGTICDALMAQTPGRTHLRDQSHPGRKPAVAVSDQEVTACGGLLPFRELKLVVEPGGAVALAALLSGKIDVERGRSQSRSCRAAMSIRNCSIVWWP